jgi:DNA-binding PadR family transcriptional regulator
LAPPRNFLYPAVLLVLAERPTHGYRVWEVLGELGFGTVDRPAVYRVLADLERDGLVQRVPGPRDDASPEKRRGLSRQVYEATADGRACLQAWMAVVAAEREALDVVLRRYWQASALPALLPRVRSENTEHPEAPTSQSTISADVLPEETDGGPSETRTPSGAPSPPVRYQVAPDRSSLVVAARSNVGPIAFTSTGLSGWVEAVVADGTLVAEPSPRAELQLPVASLLSGNRLYDRELHRRVDARRYPDVEVRLASALRLGAGNCFLVTGEVTMHGQTVRLEGVVRTTVVGPTTRRARSAGRTDERVVISGEHVVDVRSFGMATPSMGPLRLDPDVQLSLHLEADALG